MITEEENNENNLNNNKRVLKKVRHNFRHKRPEPGQDTLASVPKPIDPNIIYMLDPCTGLVEKHRKILVGARYLNMLMKIDNIMIQEQDNVKTITLNLGKPDKSLTIPWEYNIKRLESYGDLDLATWAHKIKNYYMNYPRDISKYYKKVQAGDYEMTKALEKLKAKTEQIKKEIENRYPYKKFCYRCDEEGKTLVSMTFNEDMIKEIGLNAVEDFGYWANHNGIPTLFEFNLNYLGNSGQKYLRSTVSSESQNLFRERTDINEVFYDIKGHKREVVTHEITIMEPTPYGFFCSSYHVLKEIKTFDNQTDEPGLISGNSQKQIKLRKEDKEWTTTRFQS